MVVVGGCVNRIREGLLRGFSFFVLSFLKI